MRRKRAGVVWLPNDGGNVLLAGQSVFKDFVLQVGGAGEDINIAIPLTFDAPLDAVGDSLADFEGSSYRLRRIVGKCFASVEQDAEPAAGAPGAAIFTAGFIVLRVDGTGAPLAGASGLTYSPQLLDSERDPWIWRRTWILANNQVGLAGGSNNQVANWPRNTAQYGSVADGPHIDAKTARVVKDEERLFFCAAGIGMNGSVEAGTLPLRVTLDYRLLASMYKQSGNRRNASR